VSIEERLRSALAQRAEGVEVSPGALFEIQRRIGQRRRLPRVPEVRLRPALVRAAAACAAIAVVSSVSVTGPAATGPIETETPPVAGTADPDAVAPATVDPPPTSLHGDLTPDSLITLTAHVLGRRVAVTEHLLPTAITPATPAVTRRSAPSARRSS